MPDLKFIKPQALKAGLLEEEISPIEELDLVLEITTYDNHDLVFRNIKRDAGEYGIKLVEFKTTRGPAKRDTTIQAHAEAWRLLAWWSALSQHI